MKFLKPQKKVKSMSNSVVNVMPKVKIRHNHIYCPIYKVLNIQFKCLQQHSNVPKSC